MPDRDEFFALPRKWRHLARALAAVSRGQVVDDRKVRLGLADALRGGVPLLRPVVHHFEGFEGNLPGMIPTEDLLRQIGLLRAKHAESVLDELLARNVERQILRGRIDLQGSVRALIFSLLNLVCQARRNPDLLPAPTAETQERLAPVVNLVAVELLDRPTARRFNFTPPLLPADDPSENLLGAP